MLAAFAQIEETSRSTTATAALRGACKNGHAETVAALLEFSPNLNYANYFTKWTPLMEAVHAGRTEVVRVLLEAGADLSIQAREYVVAEGSLEVADDGYLFIDVDSTDGYNATGLAVRDNRVAILRLLLDANADPNHIFVAEGIGPNFSNAHSIRSSYGSLVERVATRFSADEWYEFSSSKTKAGRKPTMAFRTPLILAVELDRAEMIPPLLDTGGDPRLVVPGLGSALSVAEQLGRTRIIDLLQAHLASTPAGE